MDGKTVGASPAYPVINAHGAPEDYPGLTKRELIAAMAMQGLCSSEQYASATSELIAAHSVEISDALLAELSKEQNDGR